MIKLHKLYNGSFGVSFVNPKGCQGMLIYSLYFLFPPHAGRRKYEKQEFSKDAVGNINILSPHHYAVSGLTQPVHLTAVN